MCQRLRQQPSLTERGKAPLTNDSIPFGSWVVLEKASSGERCELAKQMTTIGPLELQSIVDLHVTPLMTHRIALPSL